MENVFLEYSGMELVEKLIGRDVNLKSVEGDKRKNGLVK